MKFRLFKKDLQVRKLFYKAEELRKYLRLIRASIIPQVLNISNIDIEIELLLNCNKINCLENENFNYFLKFHFKCIKQTFCLYVYCYD